MVNLQHGTYKIWLALIKGKFVELLNEANSAYKNLFMNFFLIVVAITML